MDKFARLAHALTTTAPAGPAADSATVPRPLVLDSAHFFEPLQFADVPREWLSGPIDKAFVDRFLAADLSEKECRYIGFREQNGRRPLIERTVLEVAGTVLACQLAWRYRIAANTAGGTHHAHQTGGAGYTILNDLAVATHVLTSSVPGIERVLVIDLDVHQGDGSARFGAGALKDRLFTLSMHCASNYPTLKAHSTFDVGLGDGMRDEEYLDVMRTSVDKALLEIEPDFVIYDAGVDIYEHDRLGRLKVSEAGIRRRDRWVLDRCVSAEIPVAAVIGGGYDQDVDALARRHAIVHEECSYVWRKYQLWNKA